MAAFERLRSGLETRKVKLVSDSKSRFDSTVLMFRSIKYSKPVLQQLQTREDWPKSLLLTPEDYEIIFAIVEVCNLNAQCHF